MKKLILTLFIACGTYGLTFAQTVDTSSVKTGLPGAQSKVADGSSFDRAVIITEQNEKSGNQAEYFWVKNNHPDCTVKSQKLVHHNKKPYDVLQVVNGNGVALNIYFDISNSFGKF